MPVYFKRSTAPKPRLWRPPSKKRTTSTINYSGVQWIRSNGQTAGRPPLVLRNPQNDNTKYDYQKNGPEAMVALGAGQYFILYEGVTDQQGAATNFIMLAEGTNPWYLTKDAGPYYIAPNTGDWEQGEVCCTTLIRDDVERVYKLYYHGGNNAGPRQIGLMTAPIGPGRVPGTFTRYAGNPIVTDGAAGTWNANAVADACVIPSDTKPWLMFARGKPDSTISHTGRWYSNDRGYTWIADPYNPVIRATGSGNAADQATAPWGFRDEGGRIHLWVDMWDATDHRIGYAYSDNDGRDMVFSQTDVSLPPNPGGAGNDPDLKIGDVVSGIQDEGLLVFGCMNLNISAYDGDALGRLDGRGHYWLPDEAVGVPTRPARCFTNKVANSRVTVNAAASLLDQSSFTVYAEIKVPPHNTFREIYTEDHNVFNKEIYLRIKNNGQLEFYYRTTVGGAANASSTARFDNGQITPVLWVRRGVADFEMYAGPDFTSVATSTTNMGTDTPAVDGICWGNWNALDEPLMGWIRQSLTIKGTALTPAEAMRLWNRGNPGGVLPAGVTATNWVQHGSGGAAGPDAAYGGATYGTAVGAGTVVVNAAPHSVQAAPLPSIIRQNRFYTKKRSRA